MDRRGRGGSGDGALYALECEFEDLMAIVDAIDEPVYLLGNSFGAACSPEALLLTDRVKRAVLHEPGGMASSHSTVTPMDKPTQAGLPAEPDASNRVTGWEALVGWLHPGTRDSRNIEMATRALFHWVPVCAWGNIHVEMNSHDARTLFARRALGIPAAKSVNRKQRYPTTAEFTRWAEECSHANAEMTSHPPSNKFNVRAHSPSCHRIQRPPAK